MDPAPARGGSLLGFSCLVAGALGWLWAFLAGQPPSSAWHLTGYPLAVERFALHAWIVGLAVLVLAPRRRARALLALASVGALLSLGALATSAATGLLGLQVHDARGGSAAVLAARLAGGLALAAALAWAIVRRRAEDAAPAGG